MLQAKFVRIVKGGTLAMYELRGSSAELNNYVDSVTALGRTVQYKTDGLDGDIVKDANGNQTPLFFTPFPMPNKEAWHEVYQIQSGKNKGGFTLDKSDLDFDMLMSKSLGQDLGVHISEQLASKHTGVSLSTKATKVSSKSISLADDDDEDLTAETDDQTPSASGSANMDDLVDQDQPEAKASGKGNK